MEGIGEGSFVKLSCITEKFCLIGRRVYLFKTQGPSTIRGKEDRIGVAIIMNDSGWENTKWNLTLVMMEYIQNKNELQNMF